MSFLIRLPFDRYERDAFAGFRPGSFSIGNARAAMWLAQVSYEDDTLKQDRILEHWGVRRLVSYNRPFPSVLPMPSTGGFVAHGHDAVFVVFQGTDPLLLANWLSDFDFLPNSLGIHQGFDKALDVVWNDIATALEQAKPISRLIVTGHSLGAALSALCASRVADELGIIPEAVYAFGMPRVGTPAFAAKYNGKLGDRTYRLVHGTDIVPTVPPTKFGFCHVGRCIVCDAHELFEARALAAQPSDEPPFLDSWWSAAKATVRRLFFRRDLLPTDPSPIIQASRWLPAGFGDHLPDRYWRALRHST
jgi:pimeloyl-ACP methyl ester carboxylesterase